MENTKSKGVSVLRYWCYSEKRLGMFGRWVRLLKETDPAGYVPTYPSGFLSKNWFMQLWRFGESKISWSRLGVQRECKDGWRAWNAGSGERARSLRCRDNYNIVVPKALVTSIRGVGAGWTVRAHWKIWMKPGQTYPRGAQMVPLRLWVARAAQEGVGGSYLWMRMH